MKTIGQVARLFGTHADMAEAVNAANPEINGKCSVHIVQKWVQHNVVPSWWIAPIVRAARERGHAQVNADLLVDISAHRLKSGKPDNGRAA